MKSDVFLRAASVTLAASRSWCSSRAAREGEEREAGGVDVVLLDEHELARRRRLASIREFRAAGEVARRPALARALAHALCAGARNAACDDAQAAVFGPLAAALCLDRDDEAADAPAAVPDKGTAPDPSSPERACFDLCAKDHVGPSPY